MHQDNKRKKNTSELVKRISDPSADVNSVLHELRPDMDLPQLHEHLAVLMAEHNENPQRVFEKIVVERTTGYRIMSGTRSTSRNVLLRIALTMSLSLNETQLLLQVGRKALLYPRVRRDAALIYCLSHNMSLNEAEAMLLELGERSLYERC